MTRWYVTMTWDNWPDGGSYGAVVEAETGGEAEEMCRQEMAGLREDEDTTAEEYLDMFVYEWQTVDCFDLDAFIEHHRGGGSRP